MGKQIVAHQDGRLVAPLGIHGRGVAADHRLVEDVVVDQRRRVDHLDDRREDRVVGLDLGPEALAVRKHEGRGGAVLPWKSAQWSTRMLDEREDDWPARRRRLRFGLDEVGGDRGIERRELAADFLGFPATWSIDIPALLARRPRPRLDGSGHADNRRSGRPTSLPAGLGRSRSRDPPTCTCRRSSGRPPRRP